MHSQSKNLYAILGVAPDADADTLQQAYQQAIRLNSDVDEGPEKATRLALIADAYALLSNPIRRQIYDASLASGSARQIENQLHPHSPTPAPVTQHKSSPVIEGSVLNLVDPSRVKLWRKAIMLALVLALPLFYLYRHASVLQMQGDLRQTLDAQEQKDYAQSKQRSEQMQELSQLQQRRAEISYRLQELGKIDAANSTVAEAMEYDKLTEEKRTLEVRLEQLQKKYAPKY